MLVAERRRDFAEDVVEVEEKRTYSVAEEDLKTDLFVVVVVAAEQIDWVVVHFVETDSVEEIVAEQVAD